MPVASGTHLGAYEIVRLLGSGGMGEVYRAKDTKLGRDVALKILPATFTSDPDRIARFRREAQVLASLNHPHIAQIYGLDEADGTQFLVLELVDGEGLDKRIARGRIPVDEALGIARQIAEALEAAHEKGIIHRDLKPANIALTHDATVKVLDFGLAKPVEPPGNASFDVTNSPTITTPAMMTGLGSVLGTAAYMSPEQAKGRPADHRSDVFAFGCVLYEMLVGRQAFEGEDAADLLAAVVKIDIDLKTLPSNINPRLYTLLGRCLAKNPKQRWQALGDVRLELDAIMAESHGLQPRPRVGGSTWRTGALLVAAVVFLVTATAELVRNLRPVGAANVTRFPIALPPGQSFTNTGRQFLAISPDGTSLAYVANQQLHLRRMSELTTQAVQGTSIVTGLTSPVFSPDGRWIAYWAAGKLQKTAVTGGAPVTLCDAANPLGMSWVGDAIYFAQAPGGVMRVSANGGKPQSIIVATAGEVLYGPQMLPGGTSMLLTAIGRNRFLPAAQSNDGQIVVRSLKSGESRVVVDQGSDGRYVPTGHIVYAVGTTLMAVPFDARTQRIIGGPVPVVEGVRRSQVGSQYTFSDNGSLVYVSGDRGPDRNIALADPSGGARRLDIPRGPYNHPRVSPNGKQIAFQSDDGQTADVWVYDVAGGSPRRLTFQGRSTFPTWTPDGERVVYMADRDTDSGLWWQRVDGGTAELLLKTDDAAVLRPETWSPDGRVLLYSVNPAAGAGKIWMLRVSEKAKPTQVIGESTGSQISSSISPDGRWVAYTANGALYVQPFPPTGAKFQITSGGAHFPRWMRNGRQLVYATDDPSGTSELMGVNIRTESVLKFDPPVPLGVKNIVTNRDRGGFDVMPDGRHFVVLMPLSVTEPGTITSEPFIVTLNWFDELKARAPLR
jgi:serine/threonine protein kinase/Tol biopolymer transport system component